MKGNNTWNYAPYRPLLTDVGDVYICRIVPFTASIYFEWIGAGEVSYTVFYRERGVGYFLLASTSTVTNFTLNGLNSGTDYEFFVFANNKKSRVRLARCGENVGIVVNYLHPDDESYAFSGLYLCSPSLVRHLNGYLLASMDVFASGHPQNLTLIFARTTTEIVGVTSAN